MPKILLAVLLVSVSTSNVWSAHLLTPRTCLPCIFSAANLRNRIDETYESVLALPHNGVHEQNVARHYFVNLDKVRDKAREVAARELLLKSFNVNSDEEGSTSDVSSETTWSGARQSKVQQEQQRHDKRYVSCEYASLLPLLPVRHARAAEAKESDLARQRQASKRRSAVSDLTLCHFKICNMGRKRTTRYLITKHPSSSSFSSIEN